MKKYFLILFVLCAQINSAYAQSVRPIRDDIGFCWNGDEMNYFVDWLENNCEESNHTYENLIGGISVHDDYLYAGRVYFPLFKLIRAREVVIFGLVHGTVRKEVGNFSDAIILEDFDEWKGPYGNLKISPLREILKSKLNSEYFTVNNNAHSVEHSIEALIPFLQYYNRQIKITPIMISQMSFERMDKISGKLSEIITEYSTQNKLEPGKDIFFLISNDANHYGVDFNNSPYGLDLKAHELATNNDKRILAENFEGNFTSEKIINITKELWPDAQNQKQIPLWCGRYPIVMGLLTIKKTIKLTSGNEVFGKLFKYSDTLSEKVLPINKTSMGLTAVFSPKHWCGFFTLGLYKNGD